MRPVRLLLHIEEKRSRTLLENGIIHSQKKKRAAVLGHFKLARSRKYYFISERNFVSAEIRKVCLVPWCLNPSGIN